MPYINHKNAAGDDASQNKPSQKKAPPKKASQKKVSQKSPTLRRVLSAIVMIAVVIAVIEIYAFVEKSLYNKNHDTSQSNLSSISSIVNNTSTNAISNKPSPSPTPSIPDLTAKAVITSVGDIILHQAVIDGGLQKDNKYDFNPIFEYVKPYFDNSDYTIANYEGALNGPKYSGYPMFNGPDEIATALKNAGVDMVTTANNHSFDRGLAGLKRTPQVFAKEGVAVIGTRTIATDPKFQIVEINGIKIGITGYTYETAGTETNKALNGMILPKEAQDLVDSFNPSRKSLYDEDKLEMAKRIQDIKAAGAECVIFVLHWGIEYKTISNTIQKSLAQFLSDQDVDIIFGHHPHVLQEISVLPSKVTGKNTLVYYSIGNFLANMGFSTHSTNGYAEDAIIAKVSIERDKAGKVYVTKGEYVKTYVYKKKVGAKTFHKIIPVTAAILSPSLFDFGNSISIIKNSSVRIEKVFENNQNPSKVITISEAN